MSSTVQYYVKLLVPGVGPVGITISAVSEAAAAAAARAMYSAGARVTSVERVG